MPIYSLGDLQPEIDPMAYVHPDAVVVGDVVVGAGSSVWPGAVIRGDNGRISIGERTSIQDGAVLHSTYESPTTIGSECVVGHLAHLEACIVEDHVLIGSGSVVLHRAVIRSHSLVGAGAVVTDDTEVPRGAMALGVPARIFPDRVEVGAFDQAVTVYAQRADYYRKALRRLD